MTVGPMLGAILQTGLLNTSLLTAVGVAFFLITGKPARLPRLVKILILVILGMGTCLSVGFALYRSYAVPRDTLQDIIAGQEYTAGRPMHPQNMNVLMQAAVEAEPPRRTLFWWNDDLRRQEHDLYLQMFSQHWVQAHPPMMSLIAAITTRTFGVLGTQEVFTLASFVALMLMIQLLLWKYGQGLDAYWCWGLWLGLVGWCATTDALRTQPLSLILAGAITAAWVLLRRGYDASAGMILGFAILLKFVPGVLLLPLAIRHRRSSIAALALLALGTALILLVVPMSDLKDYQATTSEVLQEYAGYPMNLSALSVLVRWGEVLGWPSSMVKAYWVGLLGFAGLFWAIGLFHQPASTDTKREHLDVEFAIGFCLIPLLSPVAWGHYLVFLMMPLAYLATKLVQWKHRIAFAVILVACATPDATIQWLAELYPLQRTIVTCAIFSARTYAIIGLTIWLALLFRERNTRQWSLSPAVGS